MKLISCYNPQVVFNKYSQELVVARCGKCPACLNARSASWVERLDLEMQNHKYTWFATFQYDELNVNQLVLLRPEDSPSSFPCYLDSETGMIVDLGDVPDVKQHDIDYCNNTKVLLVHRYKDFQLFMKSLRKKIKELFPNERIRYYVAFEYGPQTFRPHLHPLFFFDSAPLSQIFPELLCTYWKYGNVFDPHIVSGSNATYVASYLNSFARQPKIYLHPYIKQKALFSKRPPIGTETLTKETFLRFFNSENGRFTIFRKDLSKFRDVSLWPSLRHRIFPKIVGFDRLSHCDRTLLYSKGQLPEYQARDYQKVKESLSNPYWQPYLNLFYSPCKYEHSKRFVFNVESLSRFVTSVVTVCNNCRLYGIDLEMYVTKIENYYETLKREELRDFYFMQNDYFKEHSLKEFLYLNPNFCLSVFKKTPSMLKDWQRFYIELYYPELLLKDEPIILQYNQCAAYRQLRGLHDKIYFDNTKVKENNDYLMANKDKFNNIITYNQELENYVQSEII